MNAQNIWVYVHLRNLGKISLLLFSCRIDSIAIHAFQQDRFFLSFLPSFSLSSVSRLYSAFSVLLWGIKVVGVFFFLFLGVQSWRLCFCRSSLKEFFFVRVCMYVWTYGYLWCMGMCMCVSVYVCIGMQSEWGWGGTCMHAGIYLSIDVCDVWLSLVPVIHYSLSFFLLFFSFLCFSAVLRK